MNVKLYKCELINQPMKFEDIPEEDMYSVFPQPVSPKDNNIVLPVRWFSDSNNGKGSGLKYFLVTKHNRMNSVNDICTGVDTDINSMTIVRVIGGPGSIIDSEHYDILSLPDRGQTRADADTLELILYCLANEASDMDKFIQENRNRFLDFKNNKNKEKLHVYNCDSNRT